MSVFEIKIFQVMACILCAVHARDSIPKETLLVIASKAYRIAYHRDIICDFPAW
jgi:hypothetical protein